MTNYNLHVDLEANDTEQGMGLLDSILCSKTVIILKLYNSEKDR